MRPTCLWTGSVAFEMRLARDERQEMVKVLSAEGMSTRAIAPIVGKSQSTVRDDLKVSRNYSPESKSDAELLAGAESIKADPQLPDLQHAHRTGASDKTVTSVRRELEAHSEIPNDIPRVNARGQERPATYDREEPAPKSDAESIKADPQLSDNSHAKRTGASWATVNAVRGELEESSQIENFETRIDPRTGEASQPATRPSPAPKSDAEPTQPDKLL